MPGDEHFAWFTFFGKFANDFEMQVNRARSQPGDPNLGGQKIVQKCRGLEIAMELGADEVNIHLVEAGTVWQPGIAVELGLGDLEKADVAPEIDNPGMVHIGPPDALVDTKVFSSHSKETIAAW